MLRAHALWLSKRRMEHSKLPIYGNQFHPEKIEFEPKAGRHVPTSEHAIAAARALAAFFVAEASKANHTSGGRPRI